MRSPEPGESHRYETGTTQQGPWPEAEEHTAKSQPGRDKYSVLSFLQSPVGASHWLNPTASQKTRRFGKAFCKGQLPEAQKLKTRSGEANNHCIPHIHIPCPNNFLFLE